jgi:hypothetical protein
MKVTTSFVVGLQSLALGILPVVSGKPLPRDAVNETAVDVSTKLYDGTVKGFSDSYGNSVFLGIPFAETTGGENRYVASDDQLCRPLLTSHIDGKRRKMSRS